MSYRLVPGLAILALLAVLASGLTACGAGAQPAGKQAVAMAPATTPRPTRIVSLDYCADQYVVFLADHERILRVSANATASYSWVRERAMELPSVRARAEDVLILQPDLVVRSYGGGPRIGEFLAQAGIPVLQVPFVNDIAGARRSLLEMAEALGVPERGYALANDMDRRLQRVAAATSDTAPEVLYLPRSGVSAGPGTLIDEMMGAAGLRNFQRRAGWHSIPLERLAYEKPQVLALAFFGATDVNLHAWSPAMHPVAQRHVREVPTVTLDSSWVSCGGWFLVEAVEALARAGAGA